MKNGTVSSEITAPYAQALMSIAQDNNVTDQVGAEAAELLDLLDSSEDLQQFLANPLVETEAKKAVLRQIAEGSVSPFVLSFLLLLVDRGRIPMVEDILRQYQALLRELNQTVLAEVTSAVDLSEEQRSDIKARVAGFTSARDVELSVQVDPSLLGGLIVQVGSQVIDASLKGQLRRIGLQLSAAT
ncbi:ATP synthase F1 subunit delta [Nodosilinea sp. P-1105]|uniref:ATP synthase F1 subunit delta n=1 Tax=Nodosilinea sp. P-1105 TaxID=2546229 RepID=UPI00146C8CA9|nr:ATP synthase F1 subunit delta [Nodosilinea sp. P-1105]NMF83488.1 F0F1 ATP synthase subunit delta [Nodosilinea sp. P-1105]